MYGAITLFRQTFQTVRLTHYLVTLCWKAVPTVGPTTPLTQRLPLTREWFGLFRFRSPLLPESLLFSFPLGTEMVHFPRLASRCLCIQHQDTLAFTKVGFPIRTFSDQNSRATPRDFSQLTTSFIAAISQGIRR